MASSAFRLPHNSKWFLHGTGDIASAALIGSRETTPAESGEFDDTDPSNVDRLVVTFDRLLANPLDGVQFGTRPATSHILLGYRGTKAISSKQYIITVDPDLRIWLHDYHSTYGTAVGYDGQNETEVRRRETWILAYEPGALLDMFTSVTLHSGGLSMKIEFPNHAMGHPQYIANLRSFVDRCNEAAVGSPSRLPPVGGLELDSATTTQAPSQVPTPRGRLVYYKDRDIGRGAFGTVYKAIRARDGTHVAIKTFSRPANKRDRDGVDPAWLTGIRREFTVVRDHPHANIIRVFDFRETPEPMIIMPYYPEGNIRDAGVVDEEGYISALGQVLDGLGHLHSYGVVHRDLKPENFLVEKKPFFKVMISDFGMAKVADSTTLLTTFCGTPKYAAPEVFPGVCHGHGPPVDIWSLGVIGLEWLYGVPRPPSLPRPKQRGSDVGPEEWRTWNEAWSGKLLYNLDDLDEEDILVKLLLGMLKLDVNRRWRAEECLAQGFKSGLFKRRTADGLIVGSGTPDDISSLAQDREEGAKTPVLSRSRQASDQESEATIILDEVKAH